MNYSRKYPVSIIVGDFDKLKYVNDNSGHKRGDSYIKKTVEIFKKIFRTEDINRCYEKIKRLSKYSKILRSFNNKIYKMIEVREF